jgi:hypothetical protein
MEFKENVQEQFRKAGWFPERNIRSEFEGIKDFHSMPPHAQHFLISYGNLLIEECRPYESEVTNTLETDPKYVKGIVWRGLPFADELYYVGYFYPDHYVIYSDASGVVYMLGDYYFKINDDFVKGIENLMEDDWSNSLEWNPDTNEWVDEY